MPLEEPTPAIEQARQIDRSRDRHLTMLWLSGAIVVAAFLLQIRERETVVVSWLPALSLPELCGSRALFGIECPGCGLTRSFVALAAGDIRESLRFHRVGWLLALAVAAQFPYRGFALWELRHRVRDRRWPAWCGQVLIAALLGNWLLR